MKIGKARARTYCHRSHVLTVSNRTDVGYQHYSLGFLFAKSFIIVGSALTLRSVCGALSWWRDLTSREGDGDPLCT